MTTQAYSRIYQSDLFELERRAEQIAAKAGSIIRKMVCGSSINTLDDLEDLVNDLRYVRDEIAARTGHLALY